MDKQKKPNRELVHFKMVHDCSPLMLQDLPHNLRVIAEEKNKMLREVYGPVTEYILADYYQNPFSRIYFEGFDGYYKNAERILQENDSCLKPARVLVSRGCSFELTEHPGFNQLLVAYNNRLGGYGKAAEYLKYDVHGKNPVEIMREIESYADNFQLIQEFLDGEKTFDFGSIREKWIGKTIEKTLKENERGILFLGRNHSEKIIKNRLSNCRYVIEDPFAVWYESADNENGDRIF